PVTVTFTAWPGATRALLFTDAAASNSICSRLTTLKSGVPAETDWPGSTERAETIPLNGDLTVALLSASSADCTALLSASRLASSAALEERACSSAEGLVSPCCANCSVLSSCCCEDCN